MKKYKAYYYNMFEEKAQKIQADTKRELVEDLILLLTDVFNSTDAVILDDGENLDYIQVIKKTEKQVISQLIQYLLK